MTPFKFASLFPKPTYETIGQGIMGIKDHFPLDFSNIIKSMTGAQFLGSISRRLYQNDTE